MTRTATFFATCLALAALAAPALSDSMRFRVESKDGRKNQKFVDVGRDGVVVLVGQLSSAPCRFNRTWGYDRMRIWVDRGCRGIFEVREGGRGWEGGSRIRYVRVESKDGRRAQSGDIGRRNWVRVSSQLSSVRCVEGRNWGVRNNRIWVDDGCRAVFAVNERH